MTSIWPLRFRHLDQGRVLFSNDVGSFFLAEDSFLLRYVTHTLTAADTAFLKSIGGTFEDPLDPDFTAFAWNWTARHHKRSSINYLILVPTLRCNLACDYCQVSRAAINAKGYDWSEETLLKVLEFIGGLSGHEIKIEFQGGEPLLRLDLLTRVANFCRSKFQRTSFVICTNLQHDLSAEQLEFIASENVSISTSLDGAPEVHTRQRTQDDALTSQFYRNLDRLCGASGSEGKINALATIDTQNPPDFESLILQYEKLGQRSIFFRPINFQGFARRTSERFSDATSWNSFYRRFIQYIINRNFRSDAVIEEYYLSHCLRRVLRPGLDGFVDLRNPNFPGSSYLVIDFDGRLYPSDEARMLARIGHVDLSLGNLETGISMATFAGAELSFANDFDPDCIHCAYQPYCGVDYVDDVSRYGRVDLPRHLTWFCQRQIDIFDLVFELLYSEDEATAYSLRRWLSVESISSKLKPTYNDTAKA